MDLGEPIREVEISPKTSPVPQPERERELPAEPVPTRREELVPA